jgi:hypothetical protein
VPSHLEDNYIIWISQLCRVQPPGKSNSNSWQNPQQFKHKGDDNLQLQVKYPKSYV